MEEYFNDFEQDNYWWGSWLGPFRALEISLLFWLIGWAKHIIGLQQIGCLMTVIALLILTAVIADT